MVIHSALDVAAIRAEFPILQRTAWPGVPLVYLDSAATSQKPRAVIEAMSRFYEQHNANIHRGVHRLAEEATAAFEDARGIIAAFIQAPTPRSIVFTRNATEAINLVARSWGGANLRTGDVVLLTEMEHHSNLVPWQMLAAERGLRLEFIPVTPEGRLDLSALPALLGLRPRLVALTHMSNMLGTINPVANIIEQAHQAGALVLVDAAQSVPHMSVNVRELGADFLAFSAHKMCGPTGVGVLYGREELLEAMPPFLGGGDMIKRVELRSFVANDIPYKFEAGTPAIAEVIGFGAAVEFLSRVGLEAVHHHEQQLAAYALERLEEVPGVRLYGPPAEERGGVVAFTLEGIHPHDIAQLLDREGIAVRAGHHCAMPVHQKFGIPASTRASLYLYNTAGEVDQLVEGLYHVKEKFA
ncbi:MAG: cysteine desulfurase [Gammaproteobacteria bacterium RBG_16_66_13]|nr:MAG: cysteine desulfurase [Gammaproteobacteria bacterium RBG_16_66_13]